MYKELCYNKLSNFDWISMQKNEFIYLISVECRYKSSKKIL